MGKRLRWPDHIEDIRAMLANGQTGAEVARHYGLKLTTCFSGLKRYGLEIDPAATLAARTAAAKAMATRPDIRAKRARAMATIAATPEARERSRQTMFARMANDPGFHARMVAASMTPDALATRKAAIQASWDSRLSWCPPNLRAEYHRLIRSKRMTKQQARAALHADISAFQQTFEGRMWKVATGRARIVEKHHFSVPVSATGPLISSTMAGI
jgi:hypothetical protein